MSLRDRAPGMFCRLSVLKLFDRRVNILQETFKKLNISEQLLETMKFQCLLLNYTSFPLIIIVIITFFVTFLTVLTNALFYQKIKYYDSPLSSGNTLAPFLCIRHSRLCRNEANPPPSLLEKMVRNLSNL